MALPLFGKMVRSIIYNYIERARIVPTEEFRWGSIDTVVFGHGPCEGLVHEPTGMWFALYPRNDHDAMEIDYACFHLGKHTVSSTSGIFLSNIDAPLGAWLKAIVAEQKATDPWASIQRVVEPIGGANAPDENFTPGERRAVEVELEAMQVALVAKLEGQAEAIERVEAVISDVKTGLVDQTKRRWSTMFLGALVQLWLEESIRTILSAVGPQVETIGKIVGTAAKLAKWIKCG